MPEDNRDSLIERFDDVGNHIKGFLNGGFGLIQGLGISLKALFEPPVTLQYPEERWEPMPGFRGVPVLPIFEDTGEVKCVGCQACARICPPQVIFIETSRNEHPRDKAHKLSIDAFTVDMSRCMLCNLCVEACPFDAITMSDHYELGGYDVGGIVLDKEQLVELYKHTNTAMILAGHSWQPAEMPSEMETEVDDNVTT